MSGKYLEIDCDLSRSKFFSTTLNSFYPLPCIYPTSKHYPSKPRELAALQLVLVKLSFQPWFNPLQAFATCLLRQTTRLSTPSPYSDLYKFWTVFKPFTYPFHLVPLFENLFLQTTCCITVGITWNSYLSTSGRSWANKLCVHQLFSVRTGVMSTSLALRNWL